MKESEVRHLHEKETEEAFLASSSSYFPGTKSIRRFNGPGCEVQLKKRGHTHFLYDICDCKKKITVTLQEEWAEFFHSQNHNWRPS